MGMVKLNQTLRQTSYHLFSFYPLLNPRLNPRTKLFFSHPDNSLQSATTIAYRGIMAGYRAIDGSQVIEVEANALAKAVHRNAQMLTGFGHAELRGGMFF